MEDIINKNEKGDFHGYQKRYWRGMLEYRGIRKNHHSIGYQEYHTIKKTKFYIK